MKFASALQRVVAWLIDLVIVFVLMMLLLGIGLISFLFTPGEFFFGLTTIASMFLVIFVYTIGLETLWEGQTVGKRALGIRAVKENGKKIKFQDALLRNIFRIIDNQLGGLVGLILIIVTKKKQRIGDFVAKTIVVQD